MLLLIISFFHIFKFKPYKLKHNHKNKKKQTNQTNLNNIINQENHNYNQYSYCDNCTNNLNHLNKECFSCPHEYLFRKLITSSNIETLNEIIKYNKSLSRFGDGEFNLLFGITHYFQVISNKLVKRLTEVLNSNETNCLIGIFYPFKNNETKIYNDDGVKYWTKHYNTHKFDLYKIIKQDKKFYSSFISKFYLIYKDKSFAPKYVKILKKLWEKRDLIIIEGENVKFGIGSDLLNNAASIKRIVCPSKHSFSLYDKIIEAVLKYNKKNYLILLSLGPAATVISYDLCKLGYQAIDIGHTDRDYILYIKNATTWIFDGENKDITKSEKEIYDKQIVNRIMQKNT